MKMRAAILILILLCLSAPPGTAAGGPRWPLDLSPQVSATFMEYRNGRFHAGLDLRTAGKTGHAVHSPFDGWVSRIRVTETGYGRMLELSNSQGQSVRFAHLEVYDDRVLGLETRILMERKNRQQRYPVEMTSPPGEIPVKAGQRVASSGDSGAGPAHLHVEWREQGQALDPLQRFPVRIKDSVAPQWTRLYLVPATAADRVGGQALPLEIPLPVPAGLRIAVSGGVDVLAACLDRKDGVGNRLNPQKIQLDVNGTPHCRIDFQRISLDRLSQAGQVFDRSRSSLAQGHYVFRLTPARSNLSNLRLEGPAGPLRVNRPLQLSLTCVDHGGNRTIQRIELVPQAAEMAHPVLALKRNGPRVKSSTDGIVYWLEPVPGTQTVSAGAWSSYGGKKPPREAWFLSRQGMLGELLVSRPLPAGGPELDLQWVDGRTRLVLTAGGADRVTWLGRGEKKMLRFSAGGFLLDCSLQEIPPDGKFRFRLHEGGGSRDVTVGWQTIPAAAGRMKSHDGSLELNWSAHAFPPQGYVLVRPVPARSAKGWKHLSAPDWKISFLPPPSKPVDLRLNLDSPSSGMRLCRIGSRPEILDDARYGSGGVEWKIPRRMTLGWRQDLHPPVLKGGGVKKLRPDSMEKTVVLHYSDQGSGVVRSGVRFRVDGRPRDMDFIAEDRVIRLPFYPWDPPGTHSYTLEVQDRAGLRTVHQGRVILVHGKQNTAGSGSGGDFPVAKKRRN